MPIVLTAPTGATVTLEEDGTWTGDATLVRLVGTVTPSIDEQYGSDPQLALARQVAEAVPGLVLVERDRADLEELPADATP